PLMDYDIRHGRTYMYFKGHPLYPFGYGLSYTTFSYSNLKLASNSISPTGDVAVSVDVKNTGKRPGEEVVQMYVKHIGSSVERPIEELKGFKRVSIESGKKQTVTMTLSGSQLAYWDINKKAFVVE